MSALAVATGPADRETDDLDLVAAVRAGDDRAFEALYRRYQPRIAAYVAGMLRDHGRAEDITQEVFMSALRRLREDDAREIHFRPWIYEIAKNKCIDAFRRARHTTEVSFDAHDQVGAAEHDRLAEPGATPDAAVEGKVAFDNLRGAFGGLSPVHHEILVMREFEGLSYREIGERMGMSRAGVESTLFRARKRLGEEYEELVSGKRCLRVQRIVEDGLRAGGLRDQRRVARHLAHCQPCRRHAHLVGADVVDLVRPGSSVGARVAAFLPLPAFLQRRWASGEVVGQLLAQQATRPVAQWTAQVAQGIDPGAVSGWAKIVVTAATVAIAGGSAFEHRAPVAPSPPAAAVGGDPQRSGAAERATSSGPATSAARPARPDVSPPAATAPAAAEAGRDAPQSRGASSGPPADGAEPPATLGLGDGSQPPPMAGLASQAPLEPVGSTGRRTLEPVVRAVGGATPGGTAATPAGGDGAAGPTPRAGRLVGAVVAPPRGVVEAASGTAGQPSAAVPSSSAATEPVASVLPRVTDVLTTPTAKHLGG